MLWAKYSINDAYHQIDFTHKVNDVDPLDAAVSAVKYISENYIPPYNLMVSGGIDSQAMLYAWKKSGINFNAISFRYNDSVNSHDLEQLKEFAERENINIEYRDFDLHNFLDSDYDRIANKYTCSSPQISTHIKFSEDMDGTIIYSGNYLNKTGPHLDYAVLGLYRYLINSTKSVIPYFFLSTPSLAYSFLKYYNSNGIVDPYKLKVKIYQDAGFPVMAQKEKYTGFEKVKEYYDEKFSDLVDNKMKLEFANKPSKRTFDLLLRYPYEKKFGNPKIHYILNNQE